MGKLLRRRKNINVGNREPRSVLLLWLPVGLLAVFLLLATSWTRLVNNFFYPYLAVSRLLSGTLADQTLLLRGKRELAQAVETLSRRNFELARRASEADALARENHRLRTLLRLEPHPGYTYVAANIIARDPWLWNDGFTIDRGSNDGLEPGLAVLGAEADDKGRTVLIGVIESVAGRSARVMTVLNPEFRISAALPDSGAVGFLNAGQEPGWDGGGAAVGFLPANRTFALNEPLLTTGFEPLVPEDILIGYLGSIESAALPFGNRLYRGGTLRPAADFARLGAVMVARPAPEKSPEAGR